MAAVLVGSSPAQGQSLSELKDLAVGQELFSACARCHGLDGRGGEHGPNIATDPDVQRMTDAELLAIIRNGIPASGMQAFGKQMSEPQIQGVSRYLRRLQGSPSNEDIAANADAGRGLFFGRAGCAECHMVNGKGGFLAADLSGYGSRHSAAEIREAILNPEKNQDVRYGAVTVVTRSRREYRGALRNEDNFSLQMQTADGRFYFFDKADLVRVQHEAKSLMPSDYGSRLTKTEVNELISFLSNTRGGEKAGSDEDRD